MQAATSNTKSAVDRMTRVDQSRKRKESNNVIDGNTQARVSAESKKTAEGVPLPDLALSAPGLVHRNRVDGDGDENGKVRHLAISPRTRSLTRAETRPQKTTAVQV